MDVVASNFDNDQLKESSIHLQRLFISVLDDFSDTSSWEELFDFLGLLPQSQLTRLSILPETSHYVLRALHCLKNSNPNGKESQNLAEQLKLVFPQLLSKKHADLSSQKQGSASRRKELQMYRRVPERTLPAKLHSPLAATVDNGKLCQYNKASIPITFSARKMTTRDMLTSADYVLEDKRSAEQRPRTIKSVRLSNRSSAIKSRQSERSLDYMFNLDPVMEFDITDSNIDVPDIPGPVKRIKPGRKYNKIMQAKIGTDSDETGEIPFSLRKLNVPLVSGMDVVRGFAFNVMPSETQEIYLNYGESVPWDPYHLVVVPKIKRNPIHFVASKFGFVHIDPDGVSELQSFAGWCRDAAVFRIIRQFPVYREYLYRKMIKIWHGNVRLSKFSLSRKKIYNVGFRFHPSFMVTLWSINSLCKDLHSLQIHSITPLSSYRRESFLKIVKTSEESLLKYLSKFWEYASLALSDVRLETESRVLELETRISHMPFVSDIPISIQKQNHLKLETDLSEAVRRKGQLDKLTTSCQLIIKEHLIQMVEISVFRWLEIVLGRQFDVVDGREMGTNDLSSAFTSTVTITTSSTLSMDIQCLFDSDLELNNDAVIGCTMTIAELREVVSDPLRLIENCVMKSSSNARTPNIACCSEVFANQNYSNSERALTELLSKTELLTSSAMEDIRNSSCVREAESVLNTALDIVSEEVTEFIGDCKWIEELSVFLLEWGEQKMGGGIAEGLEPQEIEIALMSGYKWLDKLSALSPFFATSYNLLGISTRALVSELTPRLESVMNIVQSNCVHTIHNECLRLTNMINRHHEILSCKRYDLEGFAFYAQQVRIMREERERERDNLNRSSTLLKSLLASGVAVSREVRGLMEEMETEWHQCERDIRDMEEFVHKQTPVKAIGLQENMESCEEEIMQLAQSLRNPPYTDPSAEPEQVIAELRKVNASVLGVQSRLEDLDKWRQAITGQTHNMTAVTDAIQNMDSRRAIWNHKLSFKMLEKEWLRTPFKKLDIDEMTKRLQDLIKSMDSLHHFLPPNDAVLNALSDRVSQYHNLVSLLKQLSSKAVKTPYWRTLFAAVEEDYNPDHAYTLNDLILYSLLDPCHTDLIKEVCQTAERESKLKSSLHHLQKRWEKLMLTLQQKPLFSYTFVFPKSSSPLSGNEKTTKFLFSSSQQQLQDGPGQRSHLVAAGNTKEVLVMLEEDLTELQILMGVARAETVRNHIHYWNTMLVQLHEIMQLLDTCQDKWWNMLKLFAELSHEERISAGLDQLQSCSVEFQEIMNSIHEDPFVFSLLERRRGQKGFRDLQGDSLQQGLETILEILESIGSKLSDVINDLALPFPRLLMLSNWEKLHLLNHHGNPVLVLPAIRKMFPAIQNMNTIEIHKSTSTDSAQDSTGPSREEGYQIVSVEGDLSESLYFCVPLPVGQRSSTEWLGALEKVVRYSLSCHLTGCLGSIPKRLMGHVALEEEDSAVLGWLGESVSQAVILAMECHIGFLIKTCLDGDNYRESIQTTQLSIERAINYCVQLMRNTDISSLLTTSQEKAVTNTLKNIIISLKQKQETLFNIATMDESPASIESLACFMYHTLESAGGDVSSHLGSVPPSLTGSKSSIPAICRLQNIHEALVSSTKSILGPPSKCNSSSQLFPTIASNSGKSTKSIRSLVNSVSTTCTHLYVQCGQLWKKYGFEYYGSSTHRLLMTPNTERCLYSLMKGLSEDTGGILIKESTSEELVKELAMVLGRSYCTLSCMPSVTASSLRSILLGALQMGCILSLVNIEELDNVVKIRFTGWLDDVREALDSTGLLMTSEYPKLDNCVQIGTALIPKSSLVHVPSSISTSSASLLTKTDEGTPKSNATSGLRSNETRIDWYNEDYGESLLGQRTSIELWGHRVVIRSQYACFITIPSNKMKELKVSLRCINVIGVDPRVIIEGLLIAHGFTKANELSTRLLKCLEKLQDANFLQAPVIVALKSAVRYSQYSLIETVRSLEEIHYDTLTVETSCIAKGLSRMLGIECIRRPEDRRGIVEIVTNWFDIRESDLCLCSERNEVLSSNMLLNAINRQLDETHLQKNNVFMDKILQLHYGLLHKRCAIINGGCGSGKTTVYQTLVKAYNSLINDPLTKGQVHIHTINPAAYSINEFLGSSSSNNQWQPGLFPKLLCRISTSNNTKLHLKGKTPPVSCKPIEHWVVVDGPLSENVCQWINGLISDSHSIIMPNGETLSLPDNCRLVIESESIGVLLSPLAVSQCISIYCEGLFTYRDVVRTWLKRASTLHNFCVTGIEVLSSLMDACLPPLIQFVSTSGNELLNHINDSSMDTAIFLAQKLLALLSSVLERNSPKHSDTSSHVTSTATSRGGGSISGRLSKTSSIANIHVRVHSGDIEESNSMMFRDKEIISHQSSVPSLGDHSEGVAVSELDDVLSDCSDIDADFIRNQQYHTSAMFVFTIIWSFGAYVSHRSITQFSDFIREVASCQPTCQNMLPEDGLVFDYYLNLKTYCFNPWTDKKQEKTSVNNHYVSVPELERYAYICDLYLSYGNNVLLVGDQGCGKSSFVKNLIQARTNSTVYPISHTLTSSSLQSSIITKLSQLRKRQGAGTSKKFVSQRNTFILEDLHLASNITMEESSNFDEDLFEVSEFSAIVEMLSMIIEHQRLLDRTRYFTHSLKGIRFLATSTDMGTRQLSLKVLRRFNAVPFLPLSDTSLQHIVQRRLTTWVNRFHLETEESNEALCTALSTACVTVFRNMTSRFSPSPVNPHLLFTFRDFAAVWEGMLLMSTSQVKTGGGNMAALLGRRGLARVGEGLSKQRHVSGRNTSSKTKSGKTHTATSRRGTQTGRGIRPLPSLAESSEPKHNRLTRYYTLPEIDHSTNIPRQPSSQRKSGGLSRVESRGRLQRQNTLPSTLDQSMVQKRSSDQQSFLNTSLPIDLRSRAGVGSEDRVKALSLLRAVIRLWCHELSRVYCDRLIDSKDRIWLIKLIETCCKYCFCGYEIEETSSTENNRAVQRGVARRLRPGRPKGGVSVANGNEGMTQAPVMKLQSSTLTDNGIIYNTMTQLMPKTKQVKLIGYDEMVMKGEDLSSLIFAKLRPPLTNASVENQVGSEIDTNRKQSLNYIEIGDGQVKDAINQVLDEQLKVSGEVEHIVMSKEGMEHVIRLCRALAIPSTHCLLLGPRSVGKRTVVQLAATMHNATMYSLDHISVCNAHTILRNACMSAGLEKEKTLLLVEASFESHTQSYWKQLLEIMRDGLATDLFTSSEILIMSNKISSEKLRRTTDSAFQGFAEIIKSNLHVVITWNTVTSSDVFSLKIYHDNPQREASRFVLEENWQNLFHSIFRSCSYIDKYQPWTKDSCSEIALQFWTKQEFSKLTFLNSSDLEALSYLAAHIHLTAREALNQCLLSNVKGWMGTPGDFIKCLKGAFQLYKDLKKNGEEKVHVLRSSLSHLYDLEREASNLKYKLESDLQPTLESAERSANEHKESIKTAKERYMASFEQCKNAEKTIDRETKQVKRLKQLVEDKFKEVSPIYTSALETLSSIERSVILEVTGYRAPTTGLLPVFECLCVLFDRPSTWEDCQQLMMSHNFYESLRFFDKDSVSMKKLHKLEKLLADQKKLSLSTMAKLSQAVVPIVLWIAALVDYRKAKGTMQPYHDQLNQAETTLESAQDVYVTMRHDMLATKEALEAQHLKHKEALKILKAAKTAVQDEEKRISTLQRLLDSLSNQKTIREGKLTEAQTRLDCLPSESLLLSAMLTYCNPLPLDLHYKLWHNWISYCEGKAALGSLEKSDVMNKTNIRVEHDVSIKNMLAEDDELLALERREIFPDNASLEKALLWKIRMTHCKAFIQVVFDPNDIAMQYLKGLFVSENSLDHMVYLTSSLSDFKEKLARSAEDGSKTILQVTLPIDNEYVCFILDQLLTWYKRLTQNSDKILQIDNIAVVPHDDFELVIIVPLSINDDHRFVNYLLQTFSAEQLSNMELSQQGLSALLHRHIIEESRRELNIQRRALIADLIMHKQAVLESEETIMSSISNITWKKGEYMNSSETLLKFIQDSEDRRSGSLIQVQDTQKGLKDIKESGKPYEKLANHFAMIHQTCKRISSICPQISVTLDSLRKMLTDLLHHQDSAKFSHSRTSLPAYILHLQQFASLKVHKSISPSLFPHEQLLFPLLLSLNSTLRKGLDTNLVSALTKPMLYPLLDVLHDGQYVANTGDPVDNLILLNSAYLMYLKNFYDLLISLKDNLSHWKEYFESPPTMILPLPWLGQTLSLIEKLILWKHIQPTKFIEAVQSYISLTLGPEFSNISSTLDLTSVSHASDSVTPVICVCKPENSIAALVELEHHLLQQDNVNDMQPIVLSVFDAYYQEKLIEFSQQDCTVVVNNIISMDDCIDQVTGIFETISMAKPHPSFRLYILLNDTILSKLKHHSIPWQHKVIVISCNGTNTEIQAAALLNDFHKLHCNVSYPATKSLEYATKTVLMLIEGSSESHTHSVCGNYNELDVSLLHSYLSGRKQYNAQIGHLLSQILSNYR